MAIVKIFEDGGTKFLIDDTYVMSKEEVEKSLERVGNIVAEAQIRKALKEKNASSK